MYKRIITIIVTTLLLCTGARAFTGESDLGDTIRVLRLMTGQTNSERLLAGGYVGSGNQKIDLGEAIYWLQDAAGIPYTDLQAQDYDQDFLLSALALDVTVGDDPQEIVIFDTPRVGNDDNAYNRDDLIITPIKGSTVARVEIVDSTDSVEDTYYFIRGLSEGVAVFQITYDGYLGQKPLLVVNVRAENTTGPAVETDITLTKYDTIYFTGDSADFTFTVTTDEPSAITAEHEGNTYTTSDGSFTLPLINGYNPIVITAAGSSGTTTEVINIRAKKCALTVVNATRPDSDDLYEGDIITLDVVGLVTPVPKVSRIYNPASNRVTYDTDMPRYSVFTGRTAQYSVKSLEMEMTEAGEYVLTNGHLEINVFGSPLYSEVPVGTEDPVLDAPQSDYSFSILPDIHLTVLENPDYDPDLFTITITNTEDIWPGDQVTVEIPDLDINTIDEAHQENESDWLSTGLIDSYTTFVTDIPGLDTIASDSVDTNDELENLRTLTFTIPEDTVPGTYKIRGGYVYVKYGPSWWTKVTYYHKGKIPDLTIEVVEAVPGQIHGVVSIENNTLKSRLADALGLGSDYTGDLTTAQLKAITGTMDFSGSGMTDEDMDLMQYLIGVTAIDLSGNTGITSATVKEETFDWTLEKSLDFSGCTGLTELSDKAFYECTNLVGIILPDTLTRLGDNCFAGCTSLAGIILPDTLTHLGDNCFAGCTSLAAIILPAAIETLGDKCFFNTALTQITIPEGITALGEGVFKSCTNLQDVQLPTHLETIGPECFSGCNSLTEITLPASLTSLGDNCFYRCTNLTDLTLPASLISIGDNCFSHCTNLADLTLPDVLTTIGDYVFSFCYALKMINIPAALETVGTGTFGASSSVIYGTRYFTVIDGRQSQLTSSELDVYDETIFLIGEDAQVDPLSAEVVAYHETVTLTHTIPDTETVVWGSSDASIAVVEDGVVSGVSGGIAYIYVKSESDSHSGYCRVTVTDTETATLSALELSGITLNETFDSLNYIYTADVAGDVRTTNVTLDATDSGSTLTLNGETVTAGSTTEAELTYPETVIRIAVTSGGITKTYTITIDMAAVTEKDNGEIAIGNPTLKDRLAVAAGRDAGLYTENLTIMELASITGAIDLSDADLVNLDVPVLQYLTGVSAIDLSDNTALTQPPSASYFNWATGKSLDFSGCTGIDGWSNSFREVENLTGIVLPETVTNIAGNAFRDCIKLSSVTLPADLKKIGSLAFYGCASLTRIDLPEGLEILDDSCFRGLGLTELVLPSTLTSIGEDCFAGCDALTALIIPASVTAIGESCFSGCTALALLDLRQTGFTASDVAGWEVPSTTLVIYSGTASAGLDTTSADLGLGEENLTLTHTIPDGNTVIWATTNSDVAVVSEDGVVTGVSAGTALILVYSEDGTYYEYCKVTFTETGTPGLSDLSLTGATLDQDFDSHRYYYTAKGAGQAQITAFTADVASTLTVNGSAATSGEQTDPIDLSADGTTFAIAVTTGSQVKTYTIVVFGVAVYEGGTSVYLANQAFLQALAVAAGKGEGYSGPLTYEELTLITGSLDLSGLGLTDEDMAVMKYLENVTALNLSGNTALTAASAAGEVFNWTLLGTLDFSGCTGITEILDNAFDGYRYLTGIVLPDTVLGFGEESFAETGLTAFEVPAGVIRIGEKCFSECTSLTAFTVPGGTALEEISERCFNKCTSLETFTVHGGAALKVIGDNCFYKCAALTTVTIPENGALTELGDRCFYECGIVSITLPASVKTYGEALFAKCESLTHADLSSVSTDVIADTSSLFYGCTAITSITNITLPEGLTVLPEYFFENCEGITAINLPETVTGLGNYAFSGCSGLIEADLSGMTELGEGVLSDCTSLTHVVLPNDLTALPDYFFAFCTALTTVDLPDSLTSIGAYCFWASFFGSTGGIEYLTVPSGVTSFGEGCFAVCNSLAILDLSATSLDSASFLSMNTYVPSTTTVLYAATDAGLSDSELILGSEGTATLTHTIPDGTSVSWISSNTDVVTVSEDGVITVTGTGSALIAVVSDDGTYNGTCRVIVSDSGRAVLSTLELSGITLNETFNPSVYAYTADIAGDVRSTTATLQVDGDGATLQVNGNAVTAGDAPATISLEYPGTDIVISVTSADSIFTEIYTVTITMAAVTEKSDGQVAIGNPVLKDRLTAAAGKATGNYTENLTVAELAAITGTIDLSDADLNDEDMAVMNYLTGVTAINLSGNTALTEASAISDIFDWATLTRLDFSGCTGIAGISANAFKSVSALTNIVLPETITSLGKSSFEKCTALASIEIPAGVTEIGDKCFRDTGIQSITLPAAIISIGTNICRGCVSLTQADLSGISTEVLADAEGFFRGCTAITGMADILLPEGLTALPASFFYDCTGLTAIDLPDTITSLGDSVFSGCTGIIVADLSSMTELGESVLSGCTGLTRVVLPEGITSLDSMFNGCSSLLTVDLPDSLTSIGMMCFMGSGITHLVVPAGVTSIGMFAFMNSNSLVILDLSATSLTSAALGMAMAPSTTTVLYAAADAGLSATERDMEVGNTAVLTHAVPETTTVTWISSNTDVATVSDAGVVTCSSAGIALIAVLADDESYNGTCLVTVTQDAVHEGDTSLTLVNDALTQQLGRAAGKGDDYSGALTYYELAAITGTLDLSGLGLTDADTAVMKYLTNVSAIDLSGNTALTAATVRETIFNWTTLTRLDFSGCTGITEIADNAFEGISTLESIVLPDTVTHLGESSFEQCTALTDIVIPAGVTEIGDRCFAGTSIVSITLPDTVTTIGNSVFSGCTSITAIDLPDTVTRLGESSFEQCTALTDIVIPAGVTEIGDRCFAGTGIVSITLPAAVSTIGDSVCLDCSSLTQADFSAVSTDVIADATNLFNGCSAITDMSDILLPEGLTALPEGFFEGCTGITAITLPDTITRLGDRVFSGCTSITEADLGSMTQLGQSVLSGCTGLTRVVLPEGLTSLDGMFNGCSALSSVDLPESLTGIGADCFADSGINYLIVPANVTYIDATAFTDCAALVILDLSSTSISTADVPATTTVLYAAGNAALSATELELAFGESATLTHAVPEGTPVTWLSSNTDIASVSDDGVVTGQGKGIALVAVMADDGSCNDTCLVTVTGGAVNEGDTSLTLANDDFTRRLGRAAGKGDDYSGPLTYDELAAITGTLDLSGLGLTDEEMAVMKYLTGVSTINLSGNTALTSASAAGAIFDWTTLTSLDFSGCTGITEIIDNAFEDISTLAGIVLPETVTSLGMSSFAQCTALTAIAIPEGVTEIGNRCFAGCGFISITLPAGLTTLGNWIFMDCTALTRADLTAVTVPVLEASGYLFQGCTAITGMANILLPEGLTTLPGGIFYGCTGITGINLPDTVTGLGYNAFSDCTGITSADLTGMTELGNGLFSGCTNLSRVVLPEGMASVTSNMFQSTGIVSIDLPDSITEIGMFAFSSCTELKSIVIPDSVTVLGTGAFRYCSSLESVKLSENLTELKNVTFALSGLTYLVVPSGISSIGQQCLETDSLAILDLRATEFTETEVYWGVPSDTMVLLPARDAGLSATELTLAAGETTTLTHTISGETVTWRSSNTAVATVSDTGVVTAVSEGTAMIAVQTENDTYNGTCEVTVTTAE